jgi:hypothetical protein
VQGPQLWTLLDLMRNHHADAGSRRMFARSGVFLDISASTAIRHVRPDAADAGAALRADGTTAPYVIDGAIGRVGFLAYVGQGSCQRRGHALRPSWAAFAPVRLGRSQGD